MSENEGAKESRDASRKNASSHPRHALTTLDSLIVACGASHRVDGEDRIHT